MGFVSSLVLAVTFPLLILGAIRTLDLYQTSQSKFAIYSLAGGAIAYGLASLLNLALAYFRLADNESITLFYAPLHEELLKGLLLFVIVKRSKLTYSFDGALYGFAAGIGFAIFENIGFLVRDVDLNVSVTVAAKRIISANLIHASGSAAIGIALGMVHLRRISLRGLALAAGLFLAIFQHMIYNRISINDEPLFRTVSIGVLGIAFVVLAIQLGKRQARNWIKQKLGMDDGVTRNEVLAVDRLTSTDDALFPILQRFGPEKAGQVEKLLYLEARLGLKRKALDSFQNNDPLRNALEADIHQMRVDIKAAHRAIGTHTMLFVRGLFTEEMVSVWERMQAKVSERSALTGGQKGGGLWSSLDNRLKASMDTERQE